MFKKIANRIEKKITTLSGQASPGDGSSFYELLKGISYGYGMVMKMRLWGYGAGILGKRTLPCMVISIGNAVAGGAGKTPMTICLAGILKELGKSVVVVSRGYKGYFKGDSAIVGDGEKLFMDAHMAGDEPFMMASLKQFPVVIGKNRYQGGVRAVQAFDPDVIVLDDALQHLKLNRDLDLLLMDYQRPLGNKKLLPAGRLREPFQDAAKRAGAIIFTRSQKEGTLNANAADIVGQVPRIPWFKSFHTPFIADIKSLTKKERAVKADLSELKGKRAILFSALADNSSFFQTAATAGINILDHLEFKDHYRYKEADILMINETAIKKGANIIVTTQKDWVKLESWFDWKTDVAIIGIDIRFEQKDAFVSFVKERCLNS